MLLHPGYESITVSDEIINEIYDKKKINLDQINFKTHHNNLFLQITSAIDKKRSILCVLNNNIISKIDQPTSKHANIKPRNREQLFAAWALYDDNIPVVSLTGIAGSGKTLQALAAAIDKISSKKYNRIIITKPMSQVGKYKLGSLPGGIDEKFAPYLMNYTTNLSKIVGIDVTTEDLNHYYRIELVPLQLIRGASFNNCFIIADELQVCDAQEILTLGTRVGENTKLVMMGDLNQRDEDIKIKDTGLYQFISHDKTKESSLAAHIHLVTCERSNISTLFSDVFEES